MDVIIRPAEKNDEAFLWEMLYYAAHMEDDGEVSLQAAQQNADLARYVAGWGRETDIGCIALDRSTMQPIGAAWLRLLIGNERTVSYVDDQTPELAIAVLPAYLGQGVGTGLLHHVLEMAKQHYSSVVLSVRAENPARPLYQRIGFAVSDTITNRVGTASLNMRKYL